MDDGIYRGFSAEELERQYSPRASVPDHERYADEAAARSADYRSRAQDAVYDVAYGPHPMETLDIFRPKNPAGAPLHIFIHGGYWRARVKEEFSYIAEPLVDAGAVVAVINYALCPEVSIEEIVRQTRACCAFLWRNPDVHGGDIGRIHVSGHSAGGHLAAMVMATDWPAYEDGLPADLIKSGVLLSGIYDLHPILRVSVQDDVRLDPEAVPRISPITLKPATGAPMAIAVGGAESDEFRRQTSDLARVWSAFAPVEHVEFDGLNHFSILTETATPDHPLTEIRLRLMGLG
jgi:arylformamidase